MRFVCLLCGQATDQFGCMLSFSNEGDSLVLRNTCRSPDLRIVVGPQKDVTDKKEEQLELPNSETS